MYGNTSIYASSSSSLGGVMIPAGPPGMMRRTMGNEGGGGGVGVGVGVGGMSNLSSMSMRSAMVGPSSLGSASASGFPPPPKPAQPLPPQREVPEWARFETRLQRPIVEGTPARVTEQRGHSRPVRCMAWSCDGKILATGAEDKNVKLWEYARPGSREGFNLITADSLLPATGTAVPFGNSAAGMATTAKASLTTLDGSVLHVAFAPRDPYILAVTSKGSTDPLPTSASGAVAHLQKPTSLPLSTSSSKGKVATSGASTPVPGQGDAADDPQAKDLSPPTPNAATVAAYPKLTIWDIQRRAILACFLLPHEPQSLAFHPSGHQIVVTCMNKSKKQDCLAIIWQPELVEREDEIMFESYDKDGQKRRKEAEKEWLKSLAEQGVSDRWEVRKDVHLGIPDYTVPSGEKVSEFNGLTFTPCGSRLFAGNVDGALYAWQYPIRSTTGQDKLIVNEPTAASGGEPRSADGTGPSLCLPYLFHRRLHNGCLNCLDFDPLRRYIATGGSEGVVNLVDGADWIVQRTYDSYTEEVRFLRFSWDGEFIAAAGNDRCIDIVRADHLSLLSAAN